MGSRIAGRLRRTVLVVVSVSVGLAVWPQSWASAEQSGAIPGSPRVIARSVAVGDNFACVILDNNTVKCFGENADGQLGLGDTASRGDGANEMGDNLPVVDLGTGRTAVAVTAGPAHACAILDNGQVKCWGKNHYGQLGLGDTASRGDGASEMGDNLPVVDLGTGRTAVAIAAGGNYFPSSFTCAILDNGSLKCWGRNNLGQLGLGDTSDRGDGANEMGNNLPAVNIGAGRAATAITVGNQHICVVLDNGSTKCWGSSFAGQLGQGNTSTLGDAALVPAIALPTGRIVSAMSAGGAHTCAILDNGSVGCWGDNAVGKLAIGSTIDRGDGPNEMGDNLALASLGTGRTAKALSGGDSHSCAVLDNGSLKCWGFNASGQLGIGDTSARGDDNSEIGDALTAVDLGTGRTAAATATGVSHSCAVLDNGSLKCWGANSSGQLGMGDTSARGDGANEMGDNLLAVDLGSNRSVGSTATTTSTTTVAPTTTIASGVSNTPTTTSPSTTTTQPSGTQNLPIVGGNNIAWLAMSTLLLVVGIAFLRGQSASE